jgi:hypothetical protein
MCDVCFMCTLLEELFLKLKKGKYFTITTREA